MPQQGALLLIHDSGTVASTMISQYTLTLYFMNYSNSRVFLVWYLLLFHLTYCCRADSPAHVSTLFSLAKTLFCNFLQPFCSVNLIRYSYAYLQQQYTGVIILLLFIAVVHLSLKCALLGILVWVTF